MDSEPLLSSLDKPNTKYVIEKQVRFKTSYMFGCSETQFKILTGVVLVVLIAVSWTGSTQFSKSTFSPTFHAPFFVLWYGTCFLITIYPLFTLTLLCNKKPLETYLRQTATVFGDDHNSCLGGLIVFLFNRIIPFCVLFLVTNYLYLTSLNYLLPGTVTAVFSSCACSFVYILSVAFLKDKMFILRVIAILFAISGVVLMGYSEGFGNSSYEGLVFVIISAFGSALYQVLFKHVLQEATGAQVSLFLTLLGSVNLFIFWIIIVMMYFMEWEVIDWKEVPWFNINLSGLLGLLFNFFVNFGISVTFPLFISIGILVGMPLNAVADSIFRGEAFGLYKSISLIFILASFLLMLVPNTKLVMFEQKFNCFFRGNDGAFKISENNDNVT